MFLKNEKLKHLNKIKTKPNKLLGQNFLRDKKVLAKIIAAANLTKDDAVLEVGPGEGILTEALAQQAGRVIAVEKDRALAAQLKIKFADTKNVEIIEGDILKVNFQALLSCHPERSEGSKKDSSATPQNDNLALYKVVANIPYYLTSHLIRLLLESVNPPQDIILMVQKEMAQRICPPRRARSSGEAGAKPPRMSLLSVSVQFYAEPKIIAKVPKSAFWPKPKVDSAIIRITPYNDFFPLYKRGIEGVKPHGGHAPLRGDLKNMEKIHPNPPFTKEGVANFFKVLHAGFSHPRKQLLNNLSSGLKLPRERVSKILQTADLAPAQRAETLSVKDWIRLTNTIFS